MTVTDQDRAPDWLIEREGRRDAWTLSIFIFSAVAMLGALVGVGFGVRAMDQSKRGNATALTSTPGASSSAMVHLSELKIEPSEVKLATGGTLEVMNGGAMVHN